MSTDRPGPNRPRPADELGALRRPRERRRADVEVGPEQRREEHDLAGDEQQHAHEGGVHALGAWLCRSRSRGPRSGRRRVRSLQRALRRGAATVAPCAVRRAWRRTPAARSGRAAACRSCTTAAGSWSPTPACCRPTDRPRVGGPRERDEHVPQERQDAQGDHERADRRQEVELRPAGVRRSSPRSAVPCRRGPAGAAGRRSGSCRRTAARTGSCRGSR